MEHPNVHDDLDVPGTARILDESGEFLNSNNFTLVPTPSGDPNDPLNWSQGRKWIHLACVVLYTTAICFCAACIYSIYGPLQEETGLSLADLNAGVGYEYLCMGLFGIITQPLALSIGKRPVYIMSALAGSTYPFWLTHVKSNGEWFGACIVFGFMGSTLFVLPEASICDVFFYHERALPIGIWVATQYGAALLAPLLSGFIYTGLGWRAPPYMAGGFCLLSAVVLFVFVEETNYDRHLSVPSGEDTVNHLDNGEAKHKDVATTTVAAVDDCKTAEATAIVHSVDRIFTPWPGPRPWKLFRISPHAGGIMLRGIMYPFMLCRHPTILWCGLMYALYQIFFNLQNALCSGVLSAPPYNFQPNSVGLTYISPFIATMPGAILGGYISDWYTIRQARKNGGVSEAEHKLKLFFLPTVLAPFALLMLGLGPYYGAHWMVFVAGMFVLSFIGPLAALLILTYAFDSFHSMQPDKTNSPQAEVQKCAPYLLCLMALAMLGTFGFNYVITPWAFDAGFRTFAISAAFISIALNVTYLPMLKWGKKLRQNNAAYYRKVINW